MYVQRCLGYDIYLPFVVCIPFAGHLPRISSLLIEARAINNQVLVNNELVNKGLLYLPAGHARRSGPGASGGV
jgi:hypothetical protein